MPITKSAKKALRQARSRTKKNEQEKRELRARLKELSRALTENNKEAAQTLLSRAQKSLDKAVRHGIVEKNTASRKKSQLSRAAAQLEK